MACSTQECDVPHCISARLYYGGKRLRRVSGVDAYAAGAGTLHIGGASAKADNAAQDSNEELFFHTAFGYG